MNRKNEPTNDISAKRAKRNLMIKIRVTHDEKTKIENNAQMVGMPVSHFLRKVGMGSVTRNVSEEIEVMKQLIGFRTELVKLGNLQKLWLSEVENFDEETEMSIHKIIELISRSCKTPYQRQIVCRW